MLWSVKDASDHVKHCGANEIKNDAADHDEAVLGCDRRGLSRTKSHQARDLVDMFSDLEHGERIRRL